MKKTPIIVLVAAVCFTSGVMAQNPSYTIKKGDTLYGISKKYNIKIESIKSLNNIDDPSKLYPGMQILIPGGYTVQKGDTFYSIAKKYNSTVEEICELNTLNTESMLKEGQFLHVPLIEQDQEDAVAVVDVPITEKEPLPNVDSHVDWPHSGSRTQMTGKLRGIQISGNPGDDIISVAGGTVVWASEYGIYKKLVLVEGQNGLVYGYGGNEQTMVRVGDLVAPGSVIGVLGGHSRTAEAFFFVYKDGKPVDPEIAPRV